MLSQVLNFLQYNSLLQILKIEISGLKIQCPIVVGQLEILYIIKPLKIVLL